MKINYLFHFGCLFTSSLSFFQFRSLSKMQYRKNREIFIKKPNNPLNDLENLQNLQNLELLKKYEKYRMSRYNPYIKKLASSG